ncbi:hypothetical protein HUU62_00610 [Rhodoferax sp. 4810]|nr:hypothetical protein [Rhodoferax jenense]
MPKTPDQILIFAQAPAKPAVGAPCNGCGVCCLLEPCPLGVVLSGARHGRCHALRWQADALIYRCGAITETREVLAQRLPAWLHWALPLLTSALAVFAMRWVAAGKGCDCDVELEPAARPGAKP